MADDPIFEDKTVSITRSHGFKTVPVGLGTLLETDLAKIEKRVMADMIARKDNWTDKYLSQAMYDDSATGTVGNAWGGKPFSLDDLHDAMERIQQIAGKIGPLPDRFEMSSDQANAVKRSQGGLAYSGVEVVSNPLFPMEHDCSTCGGTGEGETSTYCTNCKGAGRIKVDGMMRSGENAVFITDQLPKKFAPSFPTGLVSPPSLCKGLV